MNNIKELIQLKQAPVIEERLKSIGTEARKKIDMALSMPCTTETKSAVKGIRASLNADYKLLEEARKGVEKQIDEALSPFRDSYKQYITSVYKTADEQLKMKIAEVEEAEKFEKSENLRAYFNEIAVANNLGKVVEFEKVIPKVDLSKTETAYKKVIDAMINQINKDIEVIKNHEHSAEVMMEYVKNYSLADAIVSVQERHLRIKELSQKAQEYIEQVEKEQETVEAVDEVLSAPEIVEEEGEDIVQLSFVCIGERSKVKEFKNEIMAIANQKGIELR